MKSVASPLQTVISAGTKECLGIDLYKLTLQSSLILRWSGGDVGVSYGGNLFAKGPMIKRDKIKLAMGLQTSTMALTLTSRGAADQVAGYELFDAINREMLSGADLELKVGYYLPGNPTILDAVTRFVGRLGTARMSAAGAKFQVVSPLILLDRAFPANTYTPYCSNSVYDGNCQLNRASFIMNAAVLFSSDGFSFTTTTAMAAGYYSYGDATFTSGANKGFSQKIKVNTGTTVTFTKAWPFIPQPGDTVVLSQGCDKTKATCNTKFGNLINFRGQDKIPAPETTL